MFQEDLVPIRFPPSLRVTVHIASNKSLEMFNYQQPHTTQPPYILYSSTVVYKNWLNEERDFIPNKLLESDVQMPKEGCHYLMQIGMRVGRNGKNEFFLVLPMLREKLTIPMRNNRDVFLDRKIFFLARQCPFNHPEFGFPLQIGQILRFGKVEFKILEMRGFNQGDSSIPVKSYLENHRRRIYEDVDKLNVECKFCLETSEDESPLVGPCSCKGTTQAVHMSCLKEFMVHKLKKDINMENKYFKSWNLGEKFRCTVCKAKLPFIIVKDNKSYEVVEIPRPNTPYIILQHNYLHLCSSEEQKLQKRFYMFDFVDKNQLTFGGLSPMDIVITDRTLSSKHAMFTFDNGRFYLKDLDSTYGSLIQAHGQIPLNEPLILQAGKSVFCFTPSQ